MLNPYLKLNKNLFNKEEEKKATRDGFGKAIMLLGEKNKNVVVLSADLAESCKVDAFLEKYPNRFIECGVAEQNMAAIAAGLAVSGKIPFITSFAMFSPGKNWETIRTSIIYNRANVKIAGHHAGIVTGADGVTHQATEDISSIRAWPGINILIPCDSIEAEKITLRAASINGPVYLRFSREKTPIITTEKTPFSEKIQVFWTCKNPKTVIFATGHMLYQALLAAKELEKQNIDVLVANVSSLKPIDEEEIVRHVKKTKSAVTCEDHQVEGGLGGIISEILVQNYPAPVEFIGLKNTFAESGNAKDLLKKYKMDKNEIVTAVKKVLKRV
ncbi:MAG: transketolase C-terminal domain-containing protein [Candidatus Levyibacteriota bacterium]